MRGGKRANAGNKPSVEGSMKTISVRVRVDLIEKLRQETNQVFVINKALDLFYELGATTPTASYASSSNAAS